MKRSEARMIAEELYKLMKEDGHVEERWLSREEAAQYLGVSLSWMEHNDRGLPRRKIAGSYKYPLSGLNRFMNN